VGRAPGKNVAPPRASEQRSEALTRANEVRSARGQLKEELQHGRGDLAPLIEDPPSFLRAARISDILRALPGYGPVKVEKLLTACRISPSKTVAGLTPRQRKELAQALKG
jgi:hypothetical protein